MVRPTVFLFVGIYLQKSECVPVIVKPEYASSENSTVNSSPQNETWAEDCQYIPYTPKRSLDCISDNLLTYMESRVEGQEMTAVECLSQYMEHFEHNISNPLNLPRCPYTTPVPPPTTTTSTTITTSIPHRSSTDDDNFTWLWMAALCIGFAVAFFIIAYYKSTNNDSERSERWSGQSGGTFNYPTTQESALAETHSSYAWNPHVTQDLGWSETHMSAPTDFPLPSYDEAVKMDPPT